jgi:hypothetical protein
VPPHCSMRPTPPLAFNDQLSRGPIDRCRGRPYSPSDLLTVEHAGRSADDGFGAAAEASD